MLKTIYTRYILTRFRSSKLNGVLVPVSLVFMSPVLNVYLIGCSAGRQTDRSKGQQSRRMQNLEISRPQTILRIFVFRGRKMNSFEFAARPLLNKKSHTAKHPEACSGHVLFLFFFFLFPVFLNRRDQNNRGFQKLRIKRSNESLAP